MGNKKPFKIPRKLKISIIITIIWIILLNLTNTIVLCKCATGYRENCTDYYWLLIVKPVCHCTCSTLSDVFDQYIQLILTPFIIIYLTVSTIEKISAYIRQKTHNKPNQLH